MIWKPYMVIKCLTRKTKLTQTDKRAQLYREGQLRIINPNKKKCKKIEKENSE